MDTPTAPLTRALIWVEIALVLGVSLGRSATYAVVNIVASITAPEPLSSQSAVMNASLAPDRPWLDLTYQLLGIFFAVVPVALAGYLLVRSGTTLRSVWWGGAAGRRHRPRAPRRGRRRLGRAGVLSAQLRPRDQPDRGRRGA